MQQKGHATPTRRQHASTHAHTSMVQPDAGIAAGNAVARPCGRRSRLAQGRRSLGADARSADARSADARSADARSAHARSADARTAHVRTAHARTAHPCSPAACRHTRSVGPRSAPAVDEATENERPPRTKPPRIEQSGAMHALSCGVSPARHGLRASRQVVLGESRRLAARRTVRAGSMALTLVRSVPQVEVW